MTARRLDVLLDGRYLGNVNEDGGRYRFRYDEAYRTAIGPTPLSLSMPLSGAEYDDHVVRPFLEGLLPDNEAVLERWGREFHVSPRNPFALLRHVGADCAGAVQFAPPAEVGALLAGTGAIEWIDDREIARRLKILRRDPSAWHLSATGQFSLAGAQAKTALYLDTRTGRWGDPSGATPTTHILKPAVLGLDDHDLNEHICLRAAKGLRLNTAVSEIVRFADERAISVARYDRVDDGNGHVRRIHQEDVCQALGVPSALKYQNEDGPSAVQIVERLRTAGAARSIGSFVDALALNWIIAGTDAHAKNYSVLLSGPQVRLAPLYDVASALPYDDMYVPRLKMAMSVGGEYTLSKIARRHWQRLAVDIGLDPEAIVERVGHLVAAAPDAFADVARSEPVAALNSPLPARLVDRIAERARECAADLTRR